MRLNVGINDVWFVTFPINQSLEMHSETGRGKHVWVPVPTGQDCSCRTEMKNEIWKPRVRCETYPLGTISWKSGTREYLRRPHDGETYLLLASHMKQP